MKSDLNYEMCRGERMVDVIFHDLGEGITEGEVIHLFVRLGEQVSEGEALVEVKTDKMVVEISSPATGTIDSIHVKAKDIIPIGTVMLSINRNFTQQTRAEHNGGEGASRDDRFHDSFVSMNGRGVKGPKRIIATPSIRKMARENDVNIERIEGTGLRGRITARDIIHFLERSKRLDDVPKDLAHNIQPHLSKEKTNVNDDGKTASQFQQKVDEAIPLKRSRQRTEQLMKAYRTIPQETLFHEIDVTNVLVYEQRLKQTGVTLSRNAIFLKAVVKALRHYRMFNARRNENDGCVEQQSSYHIGLAVDFLHSTSFVIQHVDTKTILELDQEVKQLKKKAQANKLKAPERSLATFTLMNHESFGGRGVTPLIANFGTAILTLHQMIKTPIVLNDEVVSRSIMTISFSFDHRVANRMEAVAFINTFKEMIEKGDFLLLRNV